MDLNKKVDTIGECMEKISKIVGIKENEKYNLFEFINAAIQLQRNQILQAGLMVDNSTLPVGVEAIAMSLGHGVGNGSTIADSLADLSASFNSADTLIEKMDEHFQNQIDIYKSNQ